MKEVSHKEVGSPGFLELGKTVEHIEGILPFLFNQIVDVYSKRFKSMRQLHLHNAQPLHIMEDRWMACKAHIDQVSPFADCLPGEGLGKKPEFIQ